MSDQVHDQLPAPNASAATETHRLRAGMSRGFIRDLIVSGVLPWVAAVTLTRLGLPIVSALALSMIFPVADGIFSFVRYRRLDAIGIVNIGFLLGSIVISLWSGDIHVVLLKGAVLTAIFSLVCLASLLAPKPLMFFLGRQFSTRGDSALIAEWNDRWQYAQFRGIIRTITAVWGVTYLLEVVVRVALAYSLSPVLVLATAPFITYGVLACLMAWTISYSGAMRRKYAHRLEAAA